MKKVIVSVMIWVSMCSTVLPYTLQKFEHLRCMVTPPPFSAIFSKGDNFHHFLLAYLKDKVFPKWGLLTWNMQLVCSPLYIKGMLAIEKVQRRATKLVKSICQLTYQEIKTWASIAGVQERRADIIEVFKILRIN